VRADRLRARACIASQVLCPMTLSLSLVLALLELVLALVLALDSLVLAMVSLIIALVSSPRSVWGVSYVRMGHDVCPMGTSYVLCSLACPMSVLCPMALSYVLCPFLCPAALSYLPYPH